MNAGIRFQCSFCGSCEAETIDKQNGLPFKLNLQFPSMLPRPSVPKLTSGLVLIYFPLLNLLTLSPSDPVDMKASASTEWSSLRSGRFVFSTLQRWLLVFVFMCVCVCAPSQQLVSRAGKRARVFYKWACTKEARLHLSGGQLQERGLRVITRETQEQRERGRKIKAGLHRGQMKYVHVCLSTRGMVLTAIYCLSIFS